MRLLILTDGITPFVVGGMQKHSANLVRELVRCGNEVTLIHSVGYGKELPNRQMVLEALGLHLEDKLVTICIQFPRPGIFPGHYLKESYIHSKRCFKAVEEKLDNYDFIYSKGYSGWYFIERKRGGLKMPPIGVKFHGYEMFQPAPSLIQKAQQLLLRSPTRWLNVHADYVFSYGARITELITSLGVVKERIIEIPTGIDPSWIIDQPLTHKHGEVNFLFIGRYEKRKGIEELHAAIHSILDEVNAQFHFIGPIPPSKKIKHKNIHYHGQLTDPKEIKSRIDACQVLMVPSHAEGMPNVIMEGMARGLAIVATSVGAVPVVTGNENGILLPSANPVLIKAAILEVVNWSEEECYLRRSASILKVKNFSWEKIGLMTHANIQEIV
jgi:glycosyltransferase involved in cell wall biosynthesis